MKRLLAAATVAFLAACLPGKGENQPCQSTPDCQVHMICEPPECLGGDGGSVCKNECTGGNSCPTGEACVAGNTTCARCEPGTAADGG